MKTYILYVREHGQYAKNKGIIELAPRGTGVSKKFAFAAADTEEAYKFISTQFLHEDKRPLAGKSYIRSVKFVEGSKAHLEYGYPIGWTNEGKKIVANVGTIVEILSPTQFSVQFKNYHSQVDFHINETKYIEKAKTKE